MSKNQNRAGLECGAYVLSLLLLCCAASDLSAADRYWVAPLIGTWADASNWSLSSGGPGGQGLPQGGDHIFMDQRSIAIFNGSGVANANFASLTMSGAGSGSAVTQLNMGSGAMGIADLLIGDQATRCELFVSNAQLVSDSIVVGFGLSATSATLQLNGTGLIDTLTLDVAVDGANGSVDLDAGTLRVVDLAIGVDQFNLDLGKVGTLDMSGGLLDAGTLTVGEKGDAVLTQTGGTITADTYLIGTTQHPIPIVPERGLLIDERAEHDGGTVEAGTVVIGRNEPNGVFSSAGGQMIIDGSDVSASFLKLGEVDAFGYLELHSGTLDASFASIGSNTFQGQSFLGDMLHTGGSFTSSSLTLGARSATPGPTNGLRLVANYEMSGGTSDHGGVTIGEGENTDSMLTVRGDAIFTATSMRMAKDNDGEALLLILENGSVVCDSFTLGGEFQANASGDAHIIIGGGSLNAGEFRVLDWASSVTIEQWGGEFSTSFMQAKGDADYSGGITKAGGLLDGYYQTRPVFLSTNTIIRDDADFRTREFRHDWGDLTIGPGTPIISGPMILNNRTTGTLNLDWQTFVTAEADALIIMNVSLGSSMTIESGAHFPVVGTFTTDSSSGSVLTLNEGTLSCTQPINHNLGKIEGVGTIDADMNLNALLEPIIITLTGSLACGPDSVSAFQLGSVGSTTLGVQGPSVTLDGELRLNFATGAAQPLPGTEYDIITTPNATPSGTFSSVVFEGSSVPAEVVYEPGRVAVRVLYCSRADLAAPFGQIDFFDISAFISLYQAQDPVIDLAAPFGQIDFFDVSAFLSLYQAGCP